LIVPEVTEGLKMSIWLIQWRR